MKEFAGQFFWKHALLCVNGHAEKLFLKNFHEGQQHIYIIGVGRFRILGGPRFRILGAGGQGGPNSQQAHDVVTTSM